MRRWRCRGARVAKRVAGRRFGLSSSGCRCLLGGMLRNRTLLASKGMEDLLQTQGDQHGRAKAERVRVSRQHRRRRRLLPRRIRLLLSARNEPTSSAGYVGTLVIWSRQRADFGREGGFVGFEVQEGWVRRGCVSDGCGGGAWWETGRRGGAGGDGGRGGRDFACGGVARED
ncbi:hypothetical protein AAT19DRAFT_11053 [Rhodotorula toruloides]|uniref:Uncharacterized protein n=1 Tax=Rhodotorula toruloides TaxID=5286 RepID=A0A2S9ZYR3_RHOTO|nr:hypothetical protein AAT19DRAFT_11053 [Rhodotorula toruloides]